MIIEKLILKKFGPFPHYEIDFIDEEKTCILITGKNNEGKSNLIFALKLVHAGLKVIGKKRQEIFIDHQVYYRLYSQDTDNLLIPSLIHNYIDETAEVIAVLKNNFSITLFIDPIDEIIYCDYHGVIPKNSENIFGFIPYLGMIADREEFIYNTSHLKASLNTSLAPRHLRNHFVQSLTSEQYKLLQNLINATWDNITLLDYNINKFDSNRIVCFYKEKKYEREISWAGQGLQVWFQIIAHLIRLLDTSVLILDEPEINLHPEKQNDLIGIIREYYSGSIIIATHSMELMNNVNVNHIINVKKEQRKPQIKSTADRKNLEIVRSQIGSNFNFISSQFESVDYIVFTEDVDDFKIIKKLSEGFGFDYKIFNIPLHGFSEYTKAVHYKDAYKLLIGKDVLYSIVLDRDYYPDEYLSKIISEMRAAGINLVLTPEKEIENLLINPKILKGIFPAEIQEKFMSFFNDLFTDDEKNDSYGSFIKLHKDFLPSRIDTKEIIKTYSPLFYKKWTDIKERHNFLSGKGALSQIRLHYRELTKDNLSNNSIINELISTNESDSIKFIKNVFRKLPASNYQPSPLKKTP